MMIRPYLTQTPCWCFITLLFTLGTAYGQELDSLETSILQKQLQTLRLEHDQLGIPRIPGYSVELTGSDHLPVIDLQGRIHQPLTDKSVNLLFKVRRKKDGKSAEIPVSGIQVEGRYADPGINPRPFLIPSLREWHGDSGQFILAKRPGIVLGDANDPRLRQVAELLQQDLKKLLKTEAVIKAGNAEPGDIAIAFTSEDVLGEEGYRLKIDDVFHITAPGYKGAVFGTRTLLQLLAQHPDTRSIPRGESRDYPAYEVRGLVLDVGRKFFSIEFLNAYVEFMSYYKMSNFHIHLNDNAFPKYFDFDWDKTPSAFRLENERYPGLTATDGHYTKAEFIALQKKAQRYGISIIPEIDVPAHSLAIVKAVPEIGSDRFGRDHLDLDHPKTRDVVRNIFEEYISGPNPVFIGEEVHIGTDEYAKSEAEAFRSFTDFLIKTVQAAGKEVRAWGALTHAQGKTPVTSEGVTLNMWYNGYADPVEMKKLGYKQISTPDGWLYLVPAAGYYYDYLPTDRLYTQWEPRRIGKVTFEKGDPVVRGGMFALWNDIAGNGISEYDAHLRIFPAMQILAEKMWSAGDDNPPLFEFNQKRHFLTEAPGLNMRGIYPGEGPLLLDFDFEDNLNNAGTYTHEKAVSVHTGFKAGKQGKALYFADSTNYFSSPVPAIGGNYTVSFWIKPTAPLKGNLFTSPTARIYAGENGLAYQRDGYTYSLDYHFPVDEWTFVSFTGDRSGLQFYINGKLLKDMKPEKIVLPYKDKNGKEISYTKVKTLQFPLEKISPENALLDNLKVYTIKMSPEEVWSASDSTRIN